MTRFIRDLMAGTPEMLDAFGDASLIRHALAFESALAKALSAEGVIAAHVAEKIAAACATLKIDPECLGRDAAHAGTLAIPLVARLRQHIGDANIAQAVHKGATSQDVADTALVLQMKDGAVFLERDLTRLAVAIRALAQKYADTRMVGRTLLQPALSITFGLKCANWLSALCDDRVRFRHERAAALALQWGGAAGTRTGVGGNSAAIVKHMCAALKLAPAAPWHTRRNNLIAFTTGIALNITTLGKIAGDIALMSQAEIGEVAEPVITGRGGSSAMPHKRNPTGCQIALSAAKRAPGLISSLISSASNEHERGLGGWQAEAAIIADTFILAHGALTAMVTVLEGLDVYPETMQSNLERSGLDSDVGDSGLLIAEAIAAFDGDR